MEPLEREVFIDNLLVRIRLIIAMIRWTGLAPWEFEFPFPGSLHLLAYKVTKPCVQLPTNIYVAIHSVPVSSGPLQGYLVYKKLPLCGTLQ